MELNLIDGTKVKVSQEEIDRYISVKLMPNPYWRFSKILPESAIYNYLNDCMTDADIEPLAKYILFFTENIFFSTFLLNGKKDDSENLKMLDNLREKIKGCKTHADIEDILEFVFDHAIDPL